MRNEYRASLYSSRTSDLLCAREFGLLDKAANIVPMIRRLEHAGGTDKRLDGRDVCFASPHPRRAYCKWNLEPQGYGCTATRRSRNINSCAVSDSDLANEC
jgi:hypothetical protein